MLILGVDLETTSLDKYNCEIIEVGFALYDAYVHETIFQFGGLSSTIFDVPLEITEITGITDNIVKKYSIPLTSWEFQFRFLANKANYFCAHNADFDRTVLFKNFERVQVPDANLYEYSKIPWIDTMIDLPYPKRIKTRKLDYLCYEHGFANPFPHRALTDVLSMFKIFSMYDFDRILELAHSPTVWLRAQVSIDDKDLAKNRGYWWDSTNRFWAKRMKQIQVEAEAIDAPFEVEALAESYKFKEQYL